MTTIYLRFGKRCLDFVTALVALVILSPLMLAVSITIRIEDGGSVIFRQRRVGLNGRLFQLLKFRSMREDAADLPSHEARSLPVTRIGRIIRRTNIDELPQLMNIIRGEMSIVGPRPAIVSQTELVTLRSSNGVLAVRPGLTGLAQISAYSGMPVAEKVALDIAYVRSVSFWCDISIICRTIGYLRRPPPIY